MEKLVYNFKEEIVPFYFNTDFLELEKVFPGESIVYLIDENLKELYQSKFENRTTIVLPAGEQFKQQATVDHVIMQLIQMEAGRDTILAGVGGGVITDMAGYVASVYMRGIRCCLVPSTILSMVDACIGGKNGVDVDNYKNMVGTIRQPALIVYDYALLATLPEQEWISGFAEIIKHACIRDALMFFELEQTSLIDIRSSASETAKLVRKNVDIKYSVVAADPLEKGERRLLNFGHTIGHAIENMYSLPHGHAVSAGMAAAARISCRLTDFPAAELERLLHLMRAYQLPCDFEFDVSRIWQTLLRDKKRSGSEMNFILLNKIGEGVVRSIPLVELECILKELF